jgi:hypothetical protein
MITVEAPATVWLPLLERTVEEGEQVELPAEHAESLIAQGWTHIPQRAKRKAKPAEGDADDQAEGAAAPVDNRAATRAAEPSDSSKEG